MKKYLQLILDVLYPRMCAACEKTLQTDEQHLCLNCLLTLPKTQSHISSTPLIDRKFWGKMPVSQTFAFYQFSKKGKVQNILHQLKYKNKPELAEYCGKLYGNVLKSINFHEKIDMIVSIPLHKDKQKSRGYNQADHFGLGLAEALQVPFKYEVLGRNVFTKSQTQNASRAERFKNIDGVFDVLKPEAVKGMRIALVDDVLTTGATLEVAGACLLNAGCKELYIVVLASAI